MPLLDAQRLVEWSGGSWGGGVPRFIDGLSIDTRALTAGNAFVAICGTRFDGHDYVREAFGKGASCAIVRETYQVPADDAERPLLRVRDTACALRDIAAAYRRSLSVSVIAVTGSVGKTTVKELTADVLSARWPTARTRGNWNNELGLPLSLLTMNSSTRFGVFEAGMNHPGELAPLCKLLAPDWGMITAIGPVHLEFFSSVEAIAKEKAELFRQLPPDGTAVVCRDKAYYTIVREAAACRLITVSTEESADYRGDILDKDDRALVTERQSGEQMTFRMPLPGRHQLTNALFAVAAGRGFGMDWGDIGNAIERYRGQPMRWERKTIAGVLVINDAYNANPMSMLAALRIFADTQVEGGRWLVLAGMLELGQNERQAHFELGERIGQGSWAGLVTVGSMGSWIADAAERAGMERERIFRCPDHPAAADVLAGHVRSGDAVLFKASRGQHVEDVLRLWSKNVNAGD